MLNLNQIEIDLIKETMFELPYELTALMKSFLFFFCST